jgi:hypothetical protein
MKLQHAIFFIFLAAITVVGCKKETEIPDPEPATLNVKLNALFEGQPLEIGEVYYDVLGHRIRVDGFKTYISNVYAVKEDGTEVLVKSIFLADFDEENVISGEVEAGNYSGIRFGTGVPEEVNKDSDPSVYANDHPLSAIGSEGMFWHWNTGYIFTKFEGKADTLGQEGNDLLHPFAFHCGDDPFYVDHEYLNQAFSIAPTGEAEVEINFHADRFFYSDNDTIDIKQNFLTHTSGNYDLAERFMTLFGGAIEME